MLCLFWSKRNIYLLPAFIVRAFRSCLFYNSNFQYACDICYISSFYEHGGYTVTASIRWKKIAKPIKFNDTRDLNFLEQKTERDTRLNIFRFLFIGTTVDELPDVENNWTTTSR